MEAYIFPDTVSSVDTSSMNHEFKRQVSTDQTPVLFSIRILHENWEEKSKSFSLS